MESQEYGFAVGWDLEYRLSALIDYLQTGKDTFKLKSGGKNMLVHLKKKKKCIKYYVEGFGKKKKFKSQEWKIIVFL